MSHTIAQIKTFPAGTVIPKVEGTVKVIWPRESKEGAKGPYTIQNGVLKDGDDEIDFTLWDHEDMAHLKGKHACIASIGVDGRTKKKKGVETKEHFKKPGTLTLQVKGSGGGIMTGDQPNPAYMRGTPEHAAAAEQPAPTARPTESRPAARTLVSSTVNGQSIGMAIKEAAADLRGAHKGLVQDEYAFLYERASLYLALSEALSVGDSKPISPAPAATARRLYQEPDIPDQQPLDDVPF